MAESIIYEDTPFAEYLAGMQVFVVNGPLKSLDLSL